MGKRHGQGGTGAEPQDGSSRVDEMTLGEAYRQMKLGKKFPHCDIRQPVRLVSS